MNSQSTVCIVTGSATGVGAACVRRLAKEGARVLINYTRSERDARKTQEDCGALGAETLLVRADVADDQQCRMLVSQVLERWGRVDALVNNAAITKAANPFDLEALNAEDFAHVYAVNVIGAYQMTRAVALPMKKQGSGAIVNISSNVVTTGGGSSLAYTASKGALNALTLALARVLGPEIRVNAVSPGVINTRWMRDALGEDKYRALEQKFRDTAPMRRVAEAEDVADAVLWLLHGTRYVTGEIIGVDGGVRLGGGLHQARRV